MIKLSDFYSLENSKKACDIANSGRTRNQIRSMLKQLPGAVIFNSDECVYVDLSGTSWFYYPNIVCEYADGVFNSIEFTVEIPEDFDMDKVRADVKGTFYPPEIQLIRKYYEIHQ